MNLKIHKSLGKSLLIFCGFTAGISLQSCDDNKSYAELLEAETKAVNWYLSNYSVVAQIPENNEFICGEDAPFYKMNGDGTVYMRVINPGSESSRPKKGETVYFLFMRANINTMYDSRSLTGSWSGNAEDMNSSVNGTNFVYGNTVLPSTTQYGTGLQLPLDYLGYDCEVDIVIKSTEGFSADISNCVPYVYNIRYFKAEY